VDQAQYQHLKTWHDACGLMIMGPKCLDCPLALKQNPRPGRPHVIETEPWLDVKEKIRWDDMKAAKEAQPPVESDQAPEAEEMSLKKAGFVKRGAPVPVAVVEPDVLEPAPEPQKTETSSTKKRSSSRRTKKQDEPAAEDPKPVPPPAAVPEGAPSKRDVAAHAENLDAPPTEAETSTEPDKKPLEDAPAALDDSILDALADD